MSFIDLIQGGPRNIKKSLFRDITLIILITVFSIIALSLYRGIAINEEMSSQLRDNSSKLIKNSSRLIKERFTIFLTPFESSLRVLARTVEINEWDIDFNKPDRLERDFAPYFKVFENLGKITIISSTGRIASIVRSKEGLRSMLTQDEPDSQNAIRTSNSFRGAVTAPAETPVFWHESFSSQHDKSGLSASIKINLASDRFAVVIFFIPADKILQFIADIETPEAIDIVLFNKQGMFISRQQLLMGGSSNQITSKEVSSTDSSEIERALALWADRSLADDSVATFSADGMNWWAGFSRLGAETDSAWVSVLVPEAEIKNRIPPKWYNFVIPIVLIVIFAMVMVFNLVRRYSFQLKDLPHQHLIDAELTESTKRLIHLGESTTVEFKSTVRKNLNAGRFGKEIEIAWLKTITAFMNSDGGILLIGVNDDGTIRGLDDDEFTNEDKCRLHIKNLINTHIGTALSRYIHPKFCNLDDKTVLIIECERVRQPVFLSIGKNEEFYIRSGPSSMKLTMSAMITYLAER